MIGQHIDDSFLEARFVEAIPGDKAVCYKTVLGYTMRNAALRFDSKSGSDAQIKINKVVNNKISNKVVAMDKTKNKIKKSNNKVVAVNKVEMTNNNHNLNNRAVLAVKIHKNKINNHKSKVVMEQVKIHWKKKNNKMLDMTPILCGIKQ